jgi:hypothetical protein
LESSFAQWQLGVSDMGDRVFLIPLSSIQKNHF